MCVLAAASVVPPLVLVVQVWRDEPLHLAAVVIAMVLVPAHRRDGRCSRRTTPGDQRTEAVLNRYGAECSLAGGRDELFAAAQRAVDELVGEGQAQLRSERKLSGSTADHAFRAEVEVRESAWACWSPIRLPLGFASCATR